MPRPLGKIRILMSSRVLLDLEEADRVFKEKGLEEYIAYIRAKGAYEKDFDANAGGRRLSPGPLAAFAAAALRLNAGQKEPIVEIGVICKDEVDSALPIMRNLDLNGLSDVDFRVSTAGDPIALSDHKSFGTDLLLTRNADDAQFAINNGIAAAAINFPSNGSSYERGPHEPVRIWVDGDAVAFGSSAELRYRTEGLDKYRKLEEEEFNVGIEPGPFTAVLAKISALNASFPRGKQPFEISLLTARGGNGAARVLTIAEQHGIKFNGRMYFLGGAAKVEILKEHKPDLFVDDQMVHLKDAKEFCPTGLVAYAEGSPMYDYLKEQEAKEKAKQLADNKADVTKPAALETKAPQTKPGKKRRGPSSNPAP